MKAIKGTLDHILIEYPENYEIKRKIKIKALGTILEFAQWPGTKVLEVAHNSLSHIKDKITKDVSEYISLTLEREELGDSLYNKEFTISVEIDIKEEQPAC